MVDRVLSETDIETLVCTWARDHGWLTPKLQWLSQTGWPDRSFLRNGEIVWIEFKKPGGRLSAKQVFWLRRLHELGFEAYVYDNVLDAVEMLQKYD